MDYNKDIYDIPFYDFTIDELNRWKLVKDSFNIELNNNEDTNNKLTRDKIMPIIYYYVAVNSYDLAINFLKRFEDLNDPQINYLSYKLWAIVDGNALIDNNGKNELLIKFKYSNQLVDSCSLGYKPALYELMDIIANHYRYNDIGQSLFVLEPDRLFPFLSSLNDKSLLMSSLGPDDIVYKYFNLKVSKIEGRSGWGVLNYYFLIPDKRFNETNYVFPETIVNSTKRILEVMDRHTFSYKNENMNLVNLHSLKEKIGNFDHKIIRCVLGKSHRIKDSEINKCWAEILNYCKSVCESHIISGGGHVGIYLAYLFYNYNTNMKIRKESKRIARVALLYLLTNDCLIYDHHVLDMLTIKKSQIENFNASSDEKESLERVSRHLINIIVGYVKTLPDKLRYRDIRINLFNFLISHDLYRPALCVLGINLLDPNTYSFHATFDLDVVGRLKNNIFLTKIMYLVHCVTQELQHVRELYYRTFLEDINDDEYSEIHHKCNGLLLSYSRQGENKDFKSPVEILKDTYIFIHKYQQLVDAHVFYSTDSEGYLNAKMSFDKRLMQQNTN